jgi:hypothetical protein
VGALFSVIGSSDECRWLSFAGGSEEAVIWRLLTVSFMVLGIAFLSKKSWTVLDRFRLESGERSFGKC